MWNDPIIEEVRKIRSEIEAECSNDIEEIYKKALKIQKKQKGDIVYTPFKGNNLSNSIGMVKAQSKNP